LSVSVGRSARRQSLDIDKIYRNKAVKAPIKGKKFSWLFSTRLSGVR